MQPHRPHDPYTNPHGYGQGHYQRTRKIHPLVIVGIVALVMLVVGTLFFSVLLILITR